MDLHNPEQPRSHSGHRPSASHDPEPSRQPLSVRDSERQEEGLKSAHLDRTKSTQCLNGTIGNATNDQNLNGASHEAGGGSGSALNRRNQNEGQHCEAVKHESEYKNVSQKRSAFRNRIANFQWQWYACTMSTGGLAILLSEQSHTFRGLETIGKVFFVIELVLFVTFTCAMGLRFVLDRRALVRSLTDPVESFFFGCFWLSQATIIGNIQRYGVPACGPWLVKALQVLLWYYVGVTLLVAIFMFTTHWKRRDLSIDKVQPSWVLSIYPAMLSGTLASLLAPDQPTYSALTMIIGGIAFQGLGFMFSFMLITIFIWRCFNAGLPPPQMRVGMFIAVGMPGYTATALQGLATAATKHFPPGYMGVQSIPAADVLVVVSVAVGAWLWLLSFMFFAWSVAAVCMDIQEMTFDITWWASIFPNVGWVIATSLLGQILKSPGIQWVASAMTIMLVMFWVFVALFHLKAIFQGKTPHS